MTKLQLPQLAEAESVAWLLEPTLASEQRVRVPTPSIVIAGARTDLRHAVAMDVYQELHSRCDRVGCIVATGSPDAESHVLARNGAKLIFEVEALISAGAKTVRWLQLGATLNEPLLSTAFAAASECNAWILIGNWFVHGTVPTRSLWVEADSFRSRADAAARASRDSADLILPASSRGLLRRVVQDVFT